jgi:hypothetical protein
MASEESTDQVETAVDVQPETVAPEPLPEPETDLLTEPAPEPPARRTGLVVVVAALLLLLVAAIAGAMLLQPVFRTVFPAATQRDATQDKARVEAAIGLMKALRINDIPKVKPFLTDTAQKAITAEQWASAGEASEVPSATYAPTKWSGAATATVDYDIDGETGSMVFAPNPTKPALVTMTESGPDGDLVYDIALVDSGSGWRVVSLTPKAETFPLDAEFVRSLIEPPTQ